MSKESTAKNVQGYQAKPVWQECRYCLHFKSDQVKVKAAGGTGFYIEEKNLRCGKGKFKVAKLGTCKQFEQDPAKEPKI
jgi:hypothetical protein